MELHVLKKQRVADFALEQITITEAANQKGTII
jgi:hypothetical protein